MPGSGWNDTEKAGKRIRNAWNVNELPIKDFRIFLNCVKTARKDYGRKFIRVSRNKNHSLWNPYDYVNDFLKLRPYHEICKQDNPWGKSKFQEDEIMKKFLDIVTLVLALAGTALLVYSMFQPIKLWIPLLVINAGAWMGIIRLFLKNRRESGK